MKSEICDNLNHRRESPKWYCVTCGEILNDNLAPTKRTEQSHTVFDSSSAHHVANS